MMYARLTLAKWKPGSDLEAIAKIYQDSVIPAASAQKGFVAAYLLHSEDDPLDAISIALWESKEDALAGEESGYYKAQVEKFKDFFAIPPERKGYDVVAHPSD